MHSRFTVISLTLSSCLLSRVSSTSFCFHTVHGVALHVFRQFELQHKSQLLVLSDMSRDCCQGLSQPERVQAGPEPLIMPCLPALLRYYMSRTRARARFSRLGLLSLGSWKSVAVLGLLDYVQKVVDITQLHCK